MTTLIIAEAGVNHNQDKQLAFDLIDAAADAGADIVKFQTFKASLLARGSVDKAPYQRESTDPSEGQNAMLKSLELPEDWHYELQSHARAKGVHFASTAFDRASLAFLQKIDLPFHKVPSGEISNGPLLLDFARTGKKLIVSTGMSVLGEVEKALAVLAWGMSGKSDPTSFEEVWKFWSSSESQEVIKGKVSLLHCTSQYPTPLNEVNLRALSTLESAFCLPVGYSDHTQGILAPLVAVAQGAVIIEKHFTLDRGMPGPDHMASLLPGELRDMVSQIRQIDTMLGDGIKRPQMSEWGTRPVIRQKLIAGVPIEHGEMFSSENLTTSRSASGGDPMDFWDILGSKANKRFEEGDPVGWDF